MPVHSATARPTKLQLLLRIGLSLCLFGATSLTQSQINILPGNNNNSSSSSSTPTTNTCAPSPTGATCDGSGPASQGNTSGVNTGAGNPIAIASGNKYQMEVDLPALPGELGLEIVRHYNSAHARVLGPLGNGWRLSYETELYRIGQTLQVLQADGSRQTFSIDPQNPSHCTSDDPRAGHIHIGHTTNAQRKTVRHYTWRWTHGPHAGRQLHFDEAGRLQHIAAASGATLQLTRGPSGELLSVTDPQGRSLHLRYASRADIDAARARRSGGYFAGLQHIDSPLGRYSYEHADVPSAANPAQAQNASHLVRVRLPSAKDASPAHPWANRLGSSSAITRSYHYEDTRWPHMLTGISVQGQGSDGRDMAQRTATWRYNERGQAIAWWRGSAPAEPTAPNTNTPNIPSTPTPALEQMHLSVLRPALPGAPESADGLSLLTNSLGQHTLYRHRIVAGQYRLIESRGPGCATCGPSNLRYRWDKQGRLVAQETLAPLLISLPGRANTPAHTGSGAAGTTAPATPPALQAEQAHASAAALGASALLRLLQSHAPRVLARTEFDAHGMPVPYADVAGGRARTGTKTSTKTGSATSGIAYNDPRWPDKPTQLWRPSVVPGQRHSITLAYNDAGQPTRTTERGYSPIDEQGQARPTPIERTTTYTWQRINARSLLTEVDGPLPNVANAGNTAQATPLNSDITRYEWDKLGRFITRITTPGGRTHTLEHDDPATHGPLATGQLLAISNNTGQRSQMRYDPMGQLLQLRQFWGNTAANAATSNNTTPDLIRSWRYDALGQLSETGNGDPLQPDDSTHPWRPSLRLGQESGNAPAIAPGHPNTPATVHWQANALGLLQASWTDSEGQLLAWRTQNSTQARQGIAPQTALAAATRLDQAASQAPAQALRPSTKLGPGIRADIRTDIRTNTDTTAVRDDFDRIVLTRSPQHGTSWRQYDHANRLVAMHDANGHSARYHWDLQGRITRQEVLPASTSTPAPAQSSTAPKTASQAQVTTWQYTSPSQGNQQAQLHSPGHAERYAHDARGFISQRSLTLDANATSGIAPPHSASATTTPITTRTRYQHDAQGQLSAIGLPSGHWLHHQRNGQQQVTGLTLSPVQRSWLRTLAPEHPIATELRRDLAGVAHLQAGNGIATEWQRSHDASLARTLHRRTRNATGQPWVQAMAQPSPLDHLGPNQLDRLLSRTASTQDFITFLLGVSPAHAAEPPKAEVSKEKQHKSEQTETEKPGVTLSAQPGALSLPPDPTALLDTRYLWSPQGWLLHTQRHGAALHTQNTGTAANTSAPNTEHPVERQTQAYNRDGQLLASVRSTGTPEQTHQETAVWRYAWQPRTQQRLLAQQVQGLRPQEELHQGTTASRFDTQGRLASVRASEQTNTPGNRPIDGQGQATQTITYNANGQPEQVGTAQGQRSYNWDALGRLTLVRQDDQELARYAYDHRGLRTTKVVVGSGSSAVSNANANTATTTTTHTLYNPDHQPLAELNAQGRITRQYIWLADMLLAVMDSDSGLTPASANETADTADGQALAQEVPLTQDLWALVVSWGQVMGNAVTDPSWQLTFIHTNHLGAPELATNAQGQPVWAAEYAPFGDATVRTFASGKASLKTSTGTGSAPRTFTLHIRLPGQVWDAETRLHYNRQRYYDPASGQYLTPDPLGQPDGPNAYLYAAGNPLSFIDPDGLVLFAFDGTGNSKNLNDPAMAGGGITNVVNFYEEYVGNKRYVSGVGTVHEDTRYGNIIPDTYAKGTRLDWLPRSGPLWVNDLGGNYSGPARINRMMLYMRDEAQAFEKTKAMDIDIVGFSRGAAEARDFANRITLASTTINGKTYYKYTNDKTQKTECQWVNFRFMGLWDSVLSTNYSGYNYQLAIPSQFAYVAQAVALNEYRSDRIRNWTARNPIMPNYLHFGGFPLESIGASSSKPGQVRIEMGFLGAHADIGGGYAASENQLSKVALAWMLRQAKDAHVQMKAGTALPSGSAVLHDQSNAINLNNPNKPEDLGRYPPYTKVEAEDRTVNGACIGSSSSVGCVKGTTTQRSMVFADARSMSYDDTHKYITYKSRDVNQLGSGSALDAATFKNNTGTVNLDKYIAWLKSHGYKF